MLWSQCEHYCQTVNDSCGWRDPLEGVSSQVQAKERGPLFLTPRMTPGPFTVFPAPETPSEQQAESDPTVTSRLCWGSWAMRDMALKGPLKSFISSAFRWGGATNHQKRMSTLPPQDVKAKPVFKRKITVTRNSPVHQRPVVRNANELYSDLWIL